MDATFYSYNTIIEKNDMAILNNQRLLPSIDGHNGHIA
jgi:hypothetical protein